MERLRVYIYFFLLVYFIGMILLWKEEFTKHFSDLPDEGKFVSLEYSPSNRETFIVFNKTKDNIRTLFWTNVTTAPYKAYYCSAFGLKSNSVRLFGASMTGFKNDLQCCFFASSGNVTFRDTGAKYTPLPEGKGKRYVEVDRKHITLLSIC